MERIGRYRLDTLLGQGSAGRVYAATLEGPGGVERPVAVKVLSGGGQGLRREARLGGLLRHANLVDVFEVGEVDGQWFCAMERCAGSILTRMPLPPRAVVEVGLQVCAALEYAHEALGLVHLDLKPDNILVTADGRVKVADLGIARASGFDWDGTVRGTPGYMPPEQQLGGAVDLRADVYALGATLVHLATGTRQASASTWLDTQDAPMSATVGPDWLWPVTERSLAHDPAERFADMRAFGKALAALDVDGPGLAECLGVAPRVLEFTADIPPEPDAFVGREELIEGLVARLDEGGLITLRGPGGIGKTRLAARVAREWDAAHSAHGRFLDLVGTRDTAGVLFALSRALDVPQSRSDPVGQLGAALAARGPVVLIFDNVEQITGCGALLAQLAEAAPEARLLCTSRVALGVDVEQVVEIAPLDEGEAVRLLVERARLRGVALAPSPELAALARRLDGLPLAVELAAGRLGVLSVDDVAARLGQGVLRSAASDRHATLEAALRWSWDLLSPARREALALLSTFAGTFPLAAAEAVLARPASEVMALLDTLVDHSMVQVGERGRFRLLVSVKDFAAARLVEGGPGWPSPEEAETRHGRFFAETWSEEQLAQVEMKGGEARLELSRSADDLLAALDRAVARGDGSTAVGCLRAAWAVLENLSTYGLALTGARRVVAMPSLTLRERAMARLIEGLAAARESVGDALTPARLALTEARDAGDAHLEALALTGIANCLLESGGIDESLRCYEGALALYMARGDRRWEGVARSDYAVAVAMSGRTVEAREQYRRALAVVRRTGDRGTEGVVLSNLGIMYLEQGATDLAIAHLEAAVAIADEQRRWRSRATCLGNLGLAHAVAGDYTRARPLIEESLAVHTSLGYRRHQGIMLGNLGILHDRLGEHRAAVACVAEAVDLARLARNRRFEAYWLAWQARLEPGAPWAGERLAAAAGLAVQVQDPATHAEVLAMAAAVWAQRGDLPRARARLAEAEQVAPPRHAGAHEELERARELLARAHEGAG